MLILSLESSTSSAKAMLYDTETGVAQTKSATYKSCGVTNSKGVTKTEGVFQLTLSLGESLARGKDVAAIALCGTYHSISVMEDDMDASNTYSWDYMEPAAMCTQARRDPGLVEQLYGNTGCMPHVTYMRHALRYLRENGQKFDDKTLLSQGAYNFWRLTGEMRESLSTVSGSGLLNIHSLKYDDFALEYAGVRQDQLGELVRYHQTAPLTEKAAALLGIKAGIPVVPAHPDGALNQIANGAAVVGNMTLSVGTSGAVRLTSDHPVIPKSKSLWCYYGVTDWLSGAAIAGACNCLDWFKETCLGDRFSFEQLEQLRSEKDLPVFLPFIFGERCPGWQDSRRGGFVDLEAHHSAPELYYALQMGILFNLYQCYEELCRGADVPKKIIASGGILNSARWTQMIADIFQHDIILVNNMNASTLGAAVLGAHAAGAIDDVTKYTVEIDTGRVITPQKQTQEMYMQQYKRYCEWYGCTAVKM